MTQLSPRQKRIALAVCLVATMCTSPGQTYLISAFHEPLIETLEISKTKLSALYLIGTALASLPMVFVGRASDRFGPRATMIAVVSALAVACALMASVQGALSLLVAFFFLRLLGQGSLTLVSSHALTLTYDKRLGTVEGVRNGAIALAVAILPGTAVALTAWFGWRNAYLALGLGAAALVVPGALFGLRALPRGGAHQRKSVELGDSLRAALRTPAYWILVSVSVAHSALITAVHFNNQPLMRAVGLDKAGAAATMATYAATSLGGNLAGGWLADRLSPKRIFASSTAVLALSQVTLGAMDSILVAHAGMAFLGIAHGVTSASIGPTLARTFGRAHYGAIRGSFATAAVAGSSVGPILLGAWDDRFGSFDGVLYLCAAAIVPLTLATLALRKPAE